jgi:hypothetical protein
MTWKRWYGFVLIGVAVNLVLMSFEDIPLAIGIPDTMIVVLGMMIYVTFVYIGITSKGGLWEPGAS